MLSNYHSILLILIGKFTEPWNFGKPTQTCESCGAILWYEERNVKSRRPSQPKFSLCCSEGLIYLPLLKHAPPVLEELLNYDGPSFVHFHDNRRRYNAMFAMTSMGGKVDRTVNDGNGAYVFRLNGQNHHLIGSLLPVEGSKPKFAQLYIFDTENEVQHRIRSISSDKENDGIDPEIVNSLIHMLDENNALVKVFRMARDHYTECNTADVRLRLINCRTNRSSQYNLPTTSEVAGLIVNDFDPNNGYRDIIVQDRDHGLRRIK